MKLFKSKFFLFVSLLVLFTNTVPGIFFARVNAAASGCGLTDKQVRTPTSINIPSRGQSFTDPAFGCQITRLSDAKTEGAGYVSHLYSSVSPFNADSTRVILERSGGFMQIRDLAGNILKDNLSSHGIVPSSDPVWSRTDPAVLYFHPSGGNAIKSFNTQTNEVKTLRTLTNYASISFGNGEGDISWDGDHIPILADAKFGLTYTLSTDMFSQATDLLSASAGQPVDVVDATPSNKFLTLWGNLDGGVSVDGKTALDYGGHSDRGRDSDGIDLIVITNSADRTPISCQNGIVKVRLADTSSESCMTTLDWNLAVHISCNNVGQDWCLVSTYGALDPASKWPVYSAELLKVKLDGSEVMRLAHTRSSSKDYLSMPKAAVSPDGKYVLFVSDMAGAVDTYLLEISANKTTQKAKPRRVRRGFRR